MKSYKFEGMRNTPVVRCRRQLGEGFERDPFERDPLELYFRVNSGTHILTINGS